LNKKGTIRVACRGSFLNRRKRRKQRTETNTGTMQSCSHRRLRRSRRKAAWNSSPLKSLNPAQ
jgi:hypothetical protein